MNKSRAIINEGNSDSKIKDLERLRSEAEQSIRESTKQKFLKMYEMVLSGVAKAEVARKFNHTPRMVSWAIGYCQSYLLDLEDIDVSTFFLGSTVLETVLHV